MRSRWLGIVALCFVASCSPAPLQIAEDSPAPADGESPAQEAPPANNGPPRPNLTPPQANARVTVACNAYSNAETAEKIGVYFARWVQGLSLQGSSGVLAESEDDCYEYSFSGARCNDSSSNSVCQDMCQTCDAAVIDLVYNSAASVFGQITPRVRTACTAYTESEIARKVLFYESKQDAGISLAGSSGESQDECYDYSFFGPRCDESSSNDVCQDMCQTCDAAVIDIVYNGAASAFSRITSTVRTACTAYTESEIARKVLFYQSQEDAGVSSSGSNGVSRDECYEYSFFGPRCDESSSNSVCQDICQTCGAAVIRLVYGS